MGNAVIPGFKVAKVYVKCYHDCFKMTKVCVTTICLRYNKVFRVHYIEPHYKQGALYLVCYNICHQEE